MFLWRRKRGRAMPAQRLSQLPASVRPPSPLTFTPGLSTEKEQACVESSRTHARVPTSLSVSPREGFANERGTPYRLLQGRGHMSTSQSNL